MKNPGSRLTERQRQILRIIRNYLEDYGYPPTIREIGDAVGISSTSVVSYNLKRLEEMGYIIRSPDVSRGLRLVDPEKLGQEFELVKLSFTQVREVPLLGTIAAGEPIPIPDSDFSSTDYETITVPADLIGRREDVYALRVRGTSMIDALIDDGDIVIMRHQETAQNGDMVAAWLQDEKATTLKRFYWEKPGRLIRLQPANPFMDPIYVAAENLLIQGKVIGVLRELD